MRYPARIFTLFLAVLSWAFNAAGALLFLAAMVAP